MSFVLALALTPDAAALQLAQVTPLTVGTTNHAVASGAVAGASVTFAYGFAQGNTAVPGCAGTTVPIANPVVLGSVIADQRGTADYAGFVPASASGLTVLVVAVDASRCTVSNVTSNPFPLVAWADVEPIFSTDCAPCHWGASPRTASGGFALNGPGDMVNVPSNDVPRMDRIEPFDPSNSYVWHKLLGDQNTVGGSGVRMPRGGPYESQRDMDLIEQWILDGALP